MPAAFVGKLISIMKGAWISFMKHPENIGGRNTLYETV
jgi:hypothetical protein